MKSSGSRADWAKDRNNWMICRGCRQCLKAKCEFNPKQAGVDQGDRGVKLKAGDGRLPKMSSRSLHPLARQAIALSGKTDCHDWAFGLTKYLAFRDRLGCVRWTLDFVMPHVQTKGEYADAVNRSVRFLEGVLAEPSRASLQEMDQFAWLPWSHRWAVKGAGPLARLIWASMGAVLLTQPGEPTTSELPNLFLADDGPRTVAEKVV